MLTPLSGLPVRKHRAEAGRTSSDILQTGLPRKNERDMTSRRSFTEPTEAE